MNQIFTLLYRFRKNYTWYEKVYLASLMFIACTLALDCYNQDLPLSSYIYIFVTLLIVALSSIWISNELQWLLANGSTCRQSDKWYLLFLREKENNLIDYIFANEIESLTYPTSLNEQIRLLLKDIERDYVKSWYTEISGNPSFLFDVHLILEEVLFKIVDKLKSANFGFLLKNLLILYLSHLQECKRAMRKQKACNDSKENNEDSYYRYTHPACLIANHLEGLRISMGHYAETLMQEFASIEFSSSVQSRIVSSIIARKVLCKLILHMEDPIWIYTRLLYFASPNDFHSLFHKKSYLINEPSDWLQTIDDYKFRLKPSILTSTRKSDFSSNIFDRASKSLLKNGGADLSVSSKKDVLHLSLPSTTNISSVLGNLISSTAAPLLPDNASVSYQPLHKMWLSPVAEFTQELSESFSPFLKTLKDGLTPGEESKTSDLLQPTSHKERFLSQRSNILTRSCSSDALSPKTDDHVSLPRDISVGEELSEMGFPKKLTKAQSFDEGSGDIIKVGDDDSIGDEKGSAPGDVSPIYEEPEDFATTIAKLRSVLKQRESSSTLSENSGQSIDSSASKDNTFDQGDKISEPLVEEIESPMESNTACDLPNDGRPFVNITIPRTKISFSQSSTQSVHVVYTIQYDGVYMKQMPNEENQLVLRTTLVKRRFQEFVALQNRLEDNPALRVHLKGIKGPSKWPGFNFGSKIDDATIASRRAMLETYLQQLCNNVELATTLEVQQFLAYGSDGSAAFLEKSPVSPSLLRIDKFLSNKVTGVFNSLKTALPFDFEPNSPVSNGSLKELKQENQNLLQGFLSFGNKPEPDEIALEFVIKEPTVSDFISVLGGFL